MTCMTTTAKWFTRIRKLSKSFLCIETIVNYIHHSSENVQLQNGNYFFELCQIYLATTTWWIQTTIREINSCMDMRNGQNWLDASLFSSNQ